MIIKKIRLALEALYYQYKFYQMSKFRKGLNILSALDSIEYIINNKCSVSRYGDGELSMIFNLYDKKERKSYFQDFDVSLARRLEDVLRDVSENDHPKHIIGLPACMLKSPAYMTGRAARFWYRYYVTNIKLLSPYLSSIVYLDSCFTRFYMEHRNKRKSTLIANKLKKIWENKDLFIIEGEQSRLGVGNDIFDSASSIRRILCPSINAWTKYSDIYNKTIEIVPKSDNIIILIALGMTATILAKDLYIEGYQAIDIGHVDVEYEWMQRKAKKKIPIPGKYVNESRGEKFIEDEIDPKYESQICCRIL